MSKENEGAGTAADGAGEVDIKVDAADSEIELTEAAPSDAMPAREVSVPPPLPPAALHGHPPPPAPQIPLPPAQGPYGPSVHGPAQGAPAASPAQGAPPVGPPHQGPYRAPPPEPEPARAPARRVPLRNIFVAFAGIVAIGAVVAVFVFRPPPPRQARSLGARLDLAAGEVTVIDGSSKSTALSGTPLPSGAALTTGNGARALVRTGDGASVFMRADTDVALGEHGIDLRSGEVWLDTPRVEGSAVECHLGKHALSTSDSGVSVKRDGDAVTVYVARGLAILTSPGGRAEINAGEQAKVSGDAKPEVSPVAFWQDWTGGMGDQHAGGRVGSGSGRLYGINPFAPAGSPAQKLGIAKQIVHAVVRDGIAETEVDQTFSNPGGQPIEGYYWFTVPPSATVTSFALETNGQLVEGEVIERKEAAARYQAAVQQAFDPALLEWVDGRTYRARIFPVPANGSRRVVLRYIEMLPMVEGKTRYVYPLRSDDPVRFDEFALSVDVGGNGEEVDVATSLDARVESGGQLVSMRRSGFAPRADFQLEMAHKNKPAPARGWRFSAGRDQADYVMMRYVPDRDFTKLDPATANVVIVVDTSSGGADGARQVRTAAAEAAMRALSDKDHFALVALDVAPRVLYPKEGLASAKEEEISKALEALAGHTVGGATDIGALFEPALARLHGAEQPAVVYVGDGAPTSGETSADALLERLRRSLTGSRARFFALGAGADANHALLSRLAQAGGGQYLRIDEASQVTDQALRLTSAIKMPTVTDLEIDLGAALDQPFYSATGKLSRGEELVLLARTHHPLPDKIRVKGRIGGKEFTEEHKLQVASNTVTSSLVPRLWAAEYVHRLMGAGASADESRGQILQLGADYGLITPFTSSLALDSEAAYARQGIIRRRTPVRGVRLTALDPSTDESRLMGQLVPSAPPVAMGCDKRSPSKGRLSSDEESSPATVAAPPRNQETFGGNAPAQDPAPEPVAAATATANAVPADIAPAASPTMPMPVAVAPAGRAPARAAKPMYADGPGNRQGGKGAFDSDSNGVSGSLDDKTRRAMAAPKSVPLQPANAGREEKERNAKRDAAVALYRQHAQMASRVLSRCSDAASRPVSERVLLWRARAKRAQSANELAHVYDQAFASCELPDWRDEAAILDVVQRRIDTEQSAAIILAHFGNYPQAQRFIARQVLRRTVDVRLSAAVSRVLFGGVDWEKIDRELSDLDKPEKQLARIKAAVLVAPEDPRGDVRLVRYLARSGDRAEALAHGRKLRDRGFLTPALAAQLGDVLVEANAPEEAMRTYSDIVEFDGASPEARAMLGDIYMRQGWQAEAYRQYKTLTDLSAKDPLAWLRLANAAAGAGRIDEALRIEREVAAGEGTPGPSDPRYFARLASAARLGVLLSKPDPKAGVTVDAVSRKIKELGVISSPATLSLLVWDDLDSHLALAEPDPKKEQLIGDATDAAAIGLYAVLASTDAWTRAGPRAVIERADLLHRAVKFRVVTLTWDGKAFTVELKSGELPARTKSVTL
jgi:Ca-activated chloride channel homolog